MIIAALCHFARLRLLAVPEQLQSNVSSLPLDTRPLDTQPHYAHKLMNLSRAHFWPTTSMYSKDESS